MRHLATSQQLVNYLSLLVLVLGKQQSRLSGVLTDQLGSLGAIRNYRAQAPSFFIGFGKGDRNGKDCGFT